MRVDELVDSYAPMRSDEPPDWDDVQARASSQRHHRLVVALAAAFVVVCAAAAFAAGVGGFGKWLRGQPGKPAPAAEQRAFRAENRSWTAFPRDTRLRELLRTRAGGRDYALYGFRSGDTACLRLVVDAFGYSQQACLPVSTLLHSSRPLVMALSDTAIGAVQAFDSAEVGFGIVADGIRRVDVDAIDGSHRAALGGNAYLVVDSEPSTGNRFLRIRASGNGRTTAVSLPFGHGFWFGAGRPAKGPTHVQARIEHPRVGWFMRGEKRGVSLDEIRATPKQRKALEWARTQGRLRLIKPDPASGLVVGLAGNICVVSVDGGGGCGSAEHFFDYGPVNVSGRGNGGDFEELDGVAADGVRRARLFLADGTVLTPPIRNNVFATRVGRSQFPVRVVSYDRRNRIVGVYTTPTFAERIPAAARRLHRAGTVTGPNGAVATIRVGRSPAPYPRGYRCWRVDFSTGTSRAACEQTRRTRLVSVVQPAGRDLFLVGTTYLDTRRVQVRFRDGTSVFARPVGGQFVLALPRERLSTTRRAATVLVRNHAGRIVQKQEVAFRLH